MATKTQVMKEIKALGWDEIRMTLKGGFQGAAQNYSSTASKAVNGQIPVAFGMYNAYIMEDDQGLYSAGELAGSIFDEASLNASTPQAIEQAVIIATVKDGDVEFDEAKLTELGINDFEVKESIKKRLLHLVGLDYEVDDKRFQ